MPVARRRSRRRRRRRPPQPATAPRAATASRAPKARWRTRTTSRTPVARRHGGRAQAQGARDLRQHRRHLQEAAQAAGQEGRDAGGERAVQSRQQQKAYDKLRDEIIGYVKSLSLNNARIESLVEQLYSINKRLVALESRLMRLADSYGVPRQTLHRRVLRQRARPGLDRAHGERRQPQVGPVHQARDAARSTASATRSARWPPRRAWRSPSSAASSRPCRRASARRARPRRRWWRPTCASSSPSPRSTPTAACSSWT